MKKYGIFLAYPPTVDLRREGLGRQLAEMLRGAAARDDLQFVIACPSWMRESIADLLETVGLSAADSTFISPPARPLLLRALDAYQSWVSRERKTNWIRRWFRSLRRDAMKFVKQFVQTMIGVRSLLDPRLFLLILAAPLVLIYAVCRLIMALVSGFIRLLRRCASAIARGAGLTRVHATLKTMVAAPKADPMITKLFAMMFKEETDLMLRMINARKDISAWYCPTAFWPEFNLIEAPRLLCVPDVVLSQFPVGYAMVGDQRYLDSFRNVVKTIRGAEHFTTYSEEIKWGTLVDHFHIDPDRIAVAPHGANRLDDLITVSGYKDSVAATNSLCRGLLHSALSKAIDSDWASNYGVEGVKYFFYASQFRPNKNVMTLLRAYEKLLRERHLSHKLILTGNPKVMPEIAAFINQHHLVNDVLCLHGLTPAELAACYRLADLAVNPSLSEGGFPFTFTEALSVGTPVVMGRIPVTEEVIIDAGMRELSLFDPFDLNSMADCMQWGVAHRDELLTAQLKIYQSLALRSWTDVVEDHVRVLDRISLERGKTSATVGAPVAP